MLDVDKWQVTCKVDDGRGNGGCNHYATHVSLTEALATMAKHVAIAHGNYLLQTSGSDIPQVLAVQAQMWVKVP